MEIFQRVEFETLRAAWADDSPTELEMKADGFQSSDSQLLQEGF
ncbi:MAG: hypothetical protein ACRD82_11285 [Blastocatellia bacterium]